ncbi:DNA polymerase/3'-5' exonuclease PolX [Schlesneria paludicola]|uniref:DNA polymerase/3'-5' exonuclease PolX n=1 Tax=Schlesneria paludicola TaxID=360056 RepID=UPI00029A8E0E|nr:DNA polymerase/3'-5' exonuclease PolX [Schlesneria paludicola]
MQNQHIAALFNEVADLLEIQGANSFRVRAYRNGARTLENLSQSVAELVAAPGGGLETLDGIGKDLASKIAVVLQTGQLPQLEELRQQVPAGVVEMLRIPGLGPKKVAALFHELTITSLEQLKIACEAGKVAELKGFGKKTEKSILEGLPHALEAGKRFLISVARASADEIVADLKQLPTVSQVSVAGSCRRRKETCGDLDILATADDSTVVMDRLAAHPLVEKVLARGETKERVRLHTGIELDLRVVPIESYGAAMQYFTGSKEHNIVIRKRAIERGLKVNEYGVFRGDEYVAGKTEEDVYAAVGLPVIPPELRENRGEIEAAEAGTLPKLIEVADIQGDLHMHTTASDGKGTIREMAEAARARGLKYIAITDHSKRVSMANGLDATRLRQHWDEIRKVRNEVSGIEILCGIECDILEDATLDLDDEVLSEADWVIAVLHYGLKQPREQIMLRLLNAIRNPNVHAIGHPTGRMLTNRQPADIDFTTFFKAAADHGVMLEINASPERLDLDDVHAAAAKTHGIPIIIDTDSHSTNGFSVLQYGVDQARRAGLTKTDVANAASWPEFKKRLRSS